MLSQQRKQPFFIDIFWVVPTPDGPTEGTPKLPVARARPQALSKLSRLVIEGNKASDSRTVTRSPLSNVANARVVLGSHQNKRRSSEAGAVLSAGWDKENKTGVL